MLTWPEGWPPIRRAMRSCRHLSELCCSAQRGTGRISRSSIVGVPLGGKAILNVRGPPLNNYPGSFGSERIGPTGADRARRLERATFQETFPCPRAYNFVGWILSGSFSGQKSPPSHGNGGWHETRSSFHTEATEVRICIGGNRKGIKVDGRNNRDGIGEGDLDRD